MKIFYRVADDFGARRMYEMAVFYSKGDWKNNVEFVEANVDNDNNLWKECVIEFVDLGERVRLRLRSYPDRLSVSGLPSNVLEVKFLGEAVEVAKRRLEGLTGIKID